MMNFNEYQEVLNRRRELVSTITPQMLLGLAQRNPEIDRQIKECDEIIYNFNHSFPFAVRNCDTGIYEIVAMYATAEEAIKNCRNTDADVYNVVTYEHVYTAPETYTF